MSLTTNWDRNLPIVHHITKAFEDLKISKSVIYSKTHFSKSYEIINPFCDESTPWMLLTPWM